MARRTFSEISSIDGYRLPLMIALTFSTGITDAVGYLGLDRVFTANMTGNVVILAMALVGGSGLPVMGPFLALIGFLVGAAIGGRLLRHVPGGWPTRTTLVLTMVGITLTGLGLWEMWHGAVLTGSVQLIMTGLLSGAMGLQAAGARHVAVKDVTTVVVTSTLTGLAADSIFGNAKGSHPSRRGGAVLSLMCGAFVGAFLLKAQAGTGLILAGVITLAVTAIGHHVEVTQPARTHDKADEAATA